MRINENGIKRHRPKDFIVKCIVSDRHLEVDNVTADAGREGEVIKLTIAGQYGEHGRRRRMCELIVPWDDLVTALNSVSRVEMDEE